MLRTRIEPKERKFFDALPKDPDPRSGLPDEPRCRPLLFGGTIFVLLPVLGPIHRAIA